MPNLFFLREYGYAGSRAAKFTLFAAAILLLSAYTWEASLLFRADRQFSQSTFEGVKRAAGLQPSNVLYQSTLAQYYLYGQNDPQTAKSVLDRACRLDPFDARCWLDAAGVYLVLGDAAGQRAMLENAVQADPTTPAVAWEAANFYLLQGESQKALSLARLVVDNDPINAPAALERCWRATHDIQAILRWTISPTSRHRGTLLRIVLDSGDTAAAAQVWRAMLDSGSELPPAPAFAYIDELIRVRDLKAATAAWREFLARRTSSEPAAPDDLVFNGGFEHPVLNGGFDWRYRRQDQIAVGIDDEVFHSGHNSLRFLFDQVYLQTADWFQYIPVERKPYHFAVFARSEELSGAYGPRFEIRDAYTDALLFSTNDILGSTAWREYAGDFTPPPGASLLKLTVGRQDAHGALSGKMWVDDFSLTLAEERK